MTLGSDEDTNPECHELQVARREPLNPPTRNTFDACEELASDHCAVLVQMDFVEEPFVGEEEVTIHQPLAG